MLGTAWAVAQRDCFRDGRGGGLSVVIGDGEAEIRPVESQFNNAKGQSWYWLTPKTNRGLDSTCCWIPDCGSGRHTARCESLSPIFILFQTAGARHVPLAAGVTQRAEDTRSAARGGFSF
ncbi:unnamed protein product [Gadus morhua 'NCC']